MSAAPSRAMWRQACRIEKGSAVKQLVSKALSRASLGVLALAGAALSLPASAQQASLEGTWKLVPAQTALVPIDGGKVPFTKEGLADYDANRKAAAKRDLSFDQAASICSSPGLPRLMLTSDRFRILQRDTVVTMMFEWNRLFRQIEMRDVPAKRPEVDSMNGVSFGHWEGDTLVVKSLGFFPGKLLDNFVSATDTLELVERIRLKDRDTLEDRITITDPASFTQPWDTVLTYKRQPDAPFPEDLCLDRKKAGRTTWPR